MMKMQIIIRREMRRMGAAHKHIVIGRRPRFLENLYINIIRVPT